MCQPRLGRPPWRLMKLPLRCWMLLNSMRHIPRYHSRNTCSNQHPINQRILGQERAMQNILDISVITAGSYLGVHQSRRSQSHDKATPCQIYPHPSQGNLLQASSERPVINDEYPLPHRMVSAAETYLSFFPFFFFFPPLRFVSRTGCVPDRTAREN